MAKPSFETALQKLEKLVQELESGEPSLEKALKKFEEGMQLAQYCSQKLDETEKRITQLLDDAEGERLENPFADDHDTGS
jgi:exodeoxyribonuclease VII small subunit